MSVIIRTSYYLLVVFGYLLLFSSLQAQTKVTIVKSELIRGRSSSEGKIRVLSGNVHLRIKKNDLYCDSAMHLIDLDEIRAYGQVYIKGEDEQIWSDTAYYDSNLELSTFLGNVLIHRDSSLIFSTTARYSFSQKTAYFPNSLHLEDDKGILVADRGIYFTEIDSASFRGNIQLNDSSRFVLADSLLSNREKETYELFGNIYAFDDSEQSTITSQYLYLDSTGYRRIKHDALLIKIDSAKTDTAFIKASDIIYLENEDSTYQFKAYEQVEIIQEDTYTLSDSARYFSKTEDFTLLSNAYAWNNDLQLHADSIYIKAQEDTIRYITAFPNPFAAQQDSVTLRINQMRGDSILVNFKSGKLNNVIISPNAKAIYFPKNDEDEADGLMSISATRITFFFEDDELSFMRSSKDIVGTFSEESAELASYSIKGFIWSPELIPSKPLYPQPKVTKINEKGFEDYPKHHPSYKKKN